MRVPPELRDLWRDRAALGILAASLVALLAAGFDPHVYGPMSPTVQAALRDRPQLQTVYLLVTVATAASFLIGGVVGDLGQRRRLMLVGLAAMVTGQVLGLAEAGPVFVVGRLVASAGVGLVFPVGLAWVAITYHGLARATAIGIAYGAYGAGTGLAPILLNTVTPAVGPWPSFVLAAGLAGLALWIAWHRLPRADRLVTMSPAQVVSTILWAYGLLAATASIVAFGGGVTPLIRLLVFVSGVVALIIFVILRRFVMAPAGEVGIHLRPVTVVLFAGVIIALALTPPTLQATAYFQLVSGFSPLVATLAALPVTIALIAAGPVAGLLLLRLSPRVLIAGGLAAIGVGDLVIALAAPGTSYLFFVLPFVAVGAGFVIGTTIRTALIFASVPRSLPATAAALNQTSIIIGSQLGITVVTAVVARV